MKSIGSVQNQIRKKSVAKAKKVRVTTSIDRDVLMWLKVRSMEQRLGYQTLLNQLLRKAIEADAVSTPNSSEVAVQRTEFERLAKEVRSLGRSLGKALGKKREREKIRKTSRKTRSRSRA